MKNIIRPTTVILALCMAMICSSCIVHRDRPHRKPPKKHHRHKPPRHKPPHHPHASTDMMQQDGTIRPEVWYA